MERASLRWFGWFFTMLGMIYAQVNASITNNFILSVLVGLIFLETYTLLMIWFCVEIGRIK